MTTNISPITVNKWKEWNRFILCCFIKKARYFILHSFASEFFSRCRIVLILFSNLIHKSVYLISYQIPITIIHISLLIFTREHIVHLHNRNDNNESSPCRHGSYAYHIWILFFRKQMFNYPLCGGTYSVFCNCGITTDGTYHQPRHAAFLIFFVLFY